MDSDKARQRYNTILTLLIMVALLLLAHSIYLFIADGKRFPINTVKIVGTYHHITRKQLEGVLEKYLNASFFSLPVGRLQTELNAFEWAEKAQVERVWPDILKIILVEKTPIAIWNNAMLTEQGEIFNDGGKLDDISLPHLIGPVNQAQEVLQVYQKMSKILTMYNLQAMALEWRENGAWELTLTNGVYLHLGKRDLDMRVNRFCKAYPAILREKAEQLMSVDLRYPRGMAVQWKK